MTAEELARSRVHTSHRAAVRALVYAGYDFTPACHLVLQWAREARTYRTQQRPGTFTLHELLARNVK